MEQAHEATAAALLRSARWAALQRERAEAIAKQAEDEVAAAVSRAEQAWVQARAASSDSKAAEREAERLKQELTALRLQAECNAVLVAESAMKQAEERHNIKVATLTQSLRITEEELAGVKARLASGQGATRAERHGAPQCTELPLERLGEEDLQPSQQASKTADADSDRPEPSSVTSEADMTESVASELPHTWVPLRDRRARIARWTSGPSRSAGARVRRWTQDREDRLY